MPYSIQVAIQIRFSDVDMARHVHNAVYLQWFETARMELLRTFIPEEHDWRKEGLILARNEVDYRMPVRLADRIEVEVRCARVGTSSFDLAYVVKRFDGNKSDTCAEGRSVMVCFDYSTERSIPLPGLWKEALQQHMLP